MRISLTPRLLVSAIVMSMTVQAFAQDVVVSDYQFSGLSRVTADSLVPLLPAKGQVMGEVGLADSIRTLYGTEQFSDVQAQIVGNTVVYQVVERPIIAEINFDGNRLIPKEGLEQGLKQSGLGVGQVLKQATVHGIATELENQYISQGYYNSKVEVKQTPLDGNRVKLDINFTEGSPARVVDINILGNEQLSDEDIKLALLVKERNWNFLSSSSRYAQEKFAASLEALKAEYLNQGFVNFKIENATLNINEEKNSVFVEIKVNEGERYQFGESKFLGQTLYDDEKLNKLVEYGVGDQYSQALLDKTKQNIANTLGDDGYYNAQVRPVMKINDKDRAVDIDYYIDPARPVYVRRINFSGNVKTKDEVLRREMRQLEGALASAEKIQLSRLRLMRTGFFKDVKVETKAVAGSPDQMDINFVVEEQPSGSSTIAAGYSQSGGMTFQVDLSQSNFMGTGNRMNASFVRTETSESYSLGYTDPFFTVNGVSQSLGAYHKKTKYDDKNISNYVLDSTGANLVYGYPIDEKQRISGGINVDKTTVRGGPNMGISNVKQLLDDGGTANFTSDSSTFRNDYMTYSAILGWSYSSLDRAVFPTKGATHNVDLTLGFGDKTYQKAVYRGNFYRPFIKGSTLRGYTKLGYGNDLPLYENFYAGGYGSVRGYESSSLGPRSQAYQYLANGSVDSNGVPLASGDSSVVGVAVGGNAMATFGAELILPMPFKGDWTQQVRPVLFVEGGQVFDTTGAADETVDLATINSNLAALPSNARYAKLLNNDNDLRYSAGIGATWYTPIGPLSISYAYPIGDKEGDETERVQFQIGSVF